MKIDEMASKDEYISGISKKSNRYGDLLVELLETAGVMGLQEITTDQARKFCESHEIAPFRKGATA